ncbi:MAG: hypothetical protein JWR90_71 [Marmoricola sp.]|nr:hypothetical protein [Marmoricola sp.]
MSAASEVRDLRGDIRHWRRGRVDTKIIDALGDAYVTVFASLLLGSMVVSVIVNLRLVSDELCTAGGCQEARTALPWLSGLTALAVVLALARLFGPVFVSPAIGSWLLSAPVDRAALLRPRLLWTAVIAAAFSALLSAAASTLGGFGVDPLLAFCGSTALLAVAAVCLAAVSQSSAGLGARLLTWVVALVVWAGLLLIARNDGPIWSPPKDLPQGSWWGVAVVVLASVGLLTLAVGRVGRLSRHAVSPGGSLAPGLSGALATLDLALVYDVLLAHRWNAHDAVKSRRGGPSGQLALVWCDLSRLRRSPQTLVVLAAAVVVPYAAEAAGADRVVLLLSAFASFVAGLPLLAGLRVITRTPSLVRAMPFPHSATRMSTLAVPGAAMLAFGLASFPALHAALGVTWSDSVVLGLTVGGCALAGTVRWVTGRPPDYSKPLVSTPAGGVPTNLYGSIIRGFDILLLTTAPVLFSPTVNGALVSLLLSFAVLSYLVGRE